MSSNESLQNELNEHDVTGVPAKRVKAYVWNSDTLTWDRMTQPGGSSSTTTYKTIVDKSTTSNVIYIGKAPIGTATSSAAWFIKKIDKTVTDNVTITYGAAGAFTCKWTERATVVVYT